MILRRLVFILLGLCSWLSILASESDSIKVERWLLEASALPTDSCRTLHFAKKMLGVPYVAGTLDINGEEKLVVALDKVDCTTLVETVLALAIADRQEKRDFNSFKKALIHIRYRGGILNGYTSRLHYFSDWIEDNERKGIIEECTSESDVSCPQNLYLDFMSTHADSYLPMKKDTSLIDKMAKIEKRWQNKTISYIPKQELLASQDVLKIKNGDILSITTSIKGLDVVHVGFAIWKGETLHMLHASSVYKKVIEDSLSLYDYSKNKKAHTGVRAIRFIYYP